MHSVDPPNLARLTALFARDANLTFGGGMATAETLRRELVSRRGWVSDFDFRFGYAASRLTPGTNLLALCAVLGWQLGGGPGAVVALLASSIPSAIIVAALTAGYNDVVAVPGVADAVRGAVAASVALILASAWVLLRPQLVAGKRTRTLILIVLCWTAHDVFHLSALTVLLTAGALSGLWLEP